MRNVLLAEPALLPLIGLFFLVFVVAVGFIVAAIFLIVTLARKSAEPKAPQTQEPKIPLAATFQAGHKCPKCGTILKSDVPEGLCPACLLQHGIATEGGVPAGTPSFTPPPIGELAKLFPQLEILEIIGQGGMGAVYKARQPALERFVALKILAPRSGGDLDFAGRFSREARALAKLSHPNIVAVYDFGQIQRGATISASSTTAAVDTQNLSYFVMEFVDGPNLREVERAGKLTPREALEIIPQICAALQFAHDEGIVHRDIKPENVLLDKKGRVKIADFGLAKILGQEADFRLTGARDVMGTPHYMAPEQVEKPQEVDHRADIYSLGVVFYEMLTGELPLGKFDPPSHKVQIDVRLDEVVMRSLANNPDRRYQHVSQVKTELEVISTSNQAAYGMPPGFQGFDYRSKRTLFGLPLVNIASGFDPATGKVRVAKGIIAIGGRAQGVVAIGGIATGSVAIGGCAIGLVALGGAAFGVFSFGGLAIALMLALGGAAIAPVAIGGGALGYMALGGGGIGAHVFAANVQDSAAKNFFGSWGPNLLAKAQLVNAILVLLGVGLAAVAPFWMQKKGMTNGDAKSAASESTAGDNFWTAILCAFAAMVFLAFVGLLAGVSIPNFIKGRNAGRAQRLAEQAKVNINNALPEVKIATNPPASAETWAPDLTLTEKPDLQKILDEAQDLMKHGKYEEALGRQIWLQRHQIEYGGSYQNISALSSWIELGRRYPKAKQALIEIRDSEVREFAEGRGFSDLFRDIVSINQQLQDDDSTYALFKAISKGDPQLAAQCRPWADGIMLSKGEYQWCYDNLGDPQSRLAGAKRDFENEIGRVKQSAAFQERSRQQTAEFNRQRGITNFPTPSYPDSSEMMLSWATNRFVDAVGRTIEVLLGTGRSTEARQIRDQALAVMQDPRLESAITDAEARIQKRKADALEAPTGHRQGTNSAYAGLNIPAPGQWHPGVTNIPDASRETWQPTLAPGAKPDLMAIQQEAKDLMNQQRYEDSLQRQIWYHNHSISDPAQTGVRNSFALSDWVELGRRYPKAMQALIEIRDEDGRKISSGEGYFDLFLETASINSELGNQEGTRALFKKLAAAPDKALAQQCFPLAQDVLVNSGDYELCRNFMGDPESRFKKLQEQWQRTKKWEQQEDDRHRQMEERMQASRKQAESNGVPGMAGAPMTFPASPKTADKTFVAQTRQLIEILVGTHSEADAKRIRDEAVALLDVPELKNAIEEAEKRIQAPMGSAPRNGVEAMRMLPMPRPAGPPPMVPLPLPGGVIRPLRTLRPGSPGVPPVPVSPEEQVASIEMERARLQQGTGSVVLPSAAESTPAMMLLSEQPPVVVETVPASGARDVAPGETEIRVRFSKGMQDGSWSWSTAWENSAPEMISSPSYAKDGQTCVAKVKLEPGRTYAWWLNSETFHHFKDKAGRPAVPYLLIFQTKSK
jgi:predicted Ser/Thr protein kinase